jgi:hypothetical protein
MTTNPYTLNYARNILDMQERNWMFLENDSPIFTTTKRIVRLQSRLGNSYKIQNYCEAIAKLVDLNLISANEVKQNHINLFVASI